MAGMGKRMRPHTLTLPKPLLPIAGRTIVDRLVHQIAQMCQEPIEEVVFVISPHFGSAIEAQLMDIARGIQAHGTIAYQHEALGTAHAIQCAGDALNDKIVIAFADTLFEAVFTLDAEVDGVIWTKHIDDPRQFGVVELDEQGFITNFVEKPDTFISDQAIIGIYYVRDGGHLREEIQYLLDHDIREKGEYQLTNALENMKAKGARFIPGKVDEWMDCGNKNATVFTNARILSLHEEAATIHPSAQVRNSHVLEPCYIGENVVVENSIIGPHVSIEANTKVHKSVVKHSIIMQHTEVHHANLDNAMIGNYVVYAPLPADVSIGDYSQVRSKT